MANHQQTYYPANIAHLVDLIQGSRDSRVLILGFINPPKIGQSLRLINALETVKDTVEVTHGLTQSLSEDDFAFLENVQDLAPEFQNIWEDAIGQHCSESLLVEDHRLKPPDEYRRLKGLFSVTEEFKAQKLWLEVILQTAREVAQSVEKEYSDLVVVQHGLFETREDRAVELRQPWKTVWDVELKPILGEDERIRRPWRYWRVSGFSDEKLPDWESYDHIRHFLEFGWGGWTAFKRNQRKGGEEELAPLLNAVSSQLEDGIQRVYDVGSGQSGLLEAIRDGLDHSDSCEFFAYEPSGYCAGVAHGRYRSWLTVREKRLQELQCFKTQGTVVLLLGNTLAHIGAREFRTWLKQQSNRPELIVFDFALDWKGLLKRADPEIVCGRVRHLPGSEELATGEEEEKRDNYSEVGAIDWHMSTGGGPTWVKRGVVIDFRGLAEILEDSQSESEGNVQPWLQHRLFTHQEADPPETYLRILRSFGYRAIGDKAKYTSGWGRHELYFFGLQSGRTSIRWPEPQEKTATGINRAWYEYLTRVWQKAELDELGSRLELFPVAILPFECVVEDGTEARVLARYIPRSEDEIDSEKAYTDIFGAWMWVINPESDRMKPAGATKGEQVLPYAPSFFESLLSQVPNAVIQHFDQKIDEFRVNVNAADLELADLERQFFDTEDDRQEPLYYCLPVYVGGFPCYTIVVRASDDWLDPANFSEAATLLWREREAIREQLQKVMWRGELWRTVLRRWIELGEDLELPVQEWPKRVKNIENWLEPRNESRQVPRWTSWLDVQPGQSVYDVRTFEYRFEQFMDTYQEGIRAVKSCDRN